MSSIAKASFWSFLGQLVIKILPPITNMILARIFSPSIFGIVTTVTMITSFADIITDGGFNRYLIQKQYEDIRDMKRDANVAFWTNLSISLMLWLIIFVFRVELSHMLSKEDISKVIVIASLQFPITSFSTIQTAISQKFLNFKKIFFSQLMSSILNLIVTLLLALCKMGYWAIIIGNITSFIVRAIILSFGSIWQPRRYFSLKRFKKMFSFSMWIYLENISVWFTSWSDSFFVGSRLNTHDLGIYKNSQSMVNGVLAIPQYSVTNVLLVTLSKNTDNEKKYRYDFFFAQRILAYILFPLAFGILLYRDFAISIVFGKGWGDAAVVVSFWAFASVFRIIYMSITSTIYISKEKPNISFYLQILDLLILIPTCIYGINLGFSRFVILRCIIRLVIIPINLIILNNTCSIKIKDIFKNTYVPLLISLLMFFIGSMIKNVLADSLFMWVFGVLLCILIYCVLLVSFSKKDFKEMIIFIKGILKKE